MPSIPHAQLGQSEDDSFGESLMQIDEAPDHLTILTTHSSPAPPPNVGIPDQVIEKACKDLAYFFNPNDDRTVTLRSLDTAWSIVCEALCLDPALKGRLASNDEFQENVKRNGQEHFINLLRDTARRESWRGNLKNGTFLFSFDLRRSDHIPWLEIF
jgi:hypothetical protein